MWYASTRLQLKKLRGEGKKEDHLSPKSLVR